MGCPTPPGRSLCSLGHPFSSFQLFVFVLYPATFLLKPILERAEALALIDWALEAVTTGRWDAFSRSIPPFRWLHDPPAFVSLFRI